MKATEETKNEHNKLHASYYAKHTPKLEEQYCYNFYTCYWHFRRSDSQVRSPVY